MTAVLTTKGATHLMQLDAGGSTDEAFDGLVLGKGNDEPGKSDTVAAVTQRLESVLKVSDGYPKQGDTDSRNGGRGASTWTWRFERNAAEPFVASNVAIVNRAGGALIETGPVAVHAKQTVDQRRDERLIIWVNARSGEEPTVFTAFEQALEGRVQRVVGYVARNRALAAYPGGSTISSDEVRVRARAGQPIWVACDTPGREGRQLVPEDVRSLSLKVEKQEASTGQWTRITRTSLDCYKFVTGTYQYGDQRWNQAGGYNVAHLWTPPRGTKEGTYRLRYGMVLCDDDTRGWDVIVEARS